MIAGGGECVKLVFCPFGINLVEIGDVYMCCLHGTEIKVY